MSRWSPTVQPEYYGGNPGAAIADALMQYGQQKRQERTDDLWMAGERQRQSHVAAQMNHEAEMDPLEAALARLHARQQGVVPTEGSASGSPEDLAGRIKAGAGGAGETPATPASPPPRTSAQPVPGAFDVNAGDFLSALPNAGGREVAGLIAAGLLRAPVEAATGDVGHPPAAALTRPTRQPSPRVSLGGGFDYDPAAAGAFTVSDRQALDRLVGPELSDYFSRHPDQVMPYLREHNAGELTPKDRAELANRLRIAELGAGATVTSARIRGDQTADDRRENQRIVRLQRERDASLRDLQVLEGSVDYRTYTLNPSTPTIFRDRYNKARRRYVLSQQAVDTALSGGADGAEGDGEGAPPPDTAGTNRPGGRYRPENPYTSRNP